jgi:hypothetical protein
LAARVGRGSPRVSTNNRGPYSGRPSAQIALYLNLARQGTGALYDFRIGAKSQVDARQRKEFSPSSYGAPAVSLAPLRRPAAKKRQVAAPSAVLQGLSALSNSSRSMTAMLVAESLIA